MTSFWKNKKVLVTGGLGFVGSHLVEQLVTMGSKVTILDHVTSKKLINIEQVRSKISIVNGDCDVIADARTACEGQDIVMNLAARVGGIEYNQQHQGSILSANLNIASTILEAARQSKVSKVLAVSSACVYPRDAHIPTPESEGFRDEPEPTNGGYGWAKRMQELLSKYYSEEYNMEIAVVRPYNTYGPRDHFEPDKSHVIPSLIRRIYNNENPLNVWGSGKQSRAFLYVTDLVHGMLLACEKSTTTNPINLGTDEEVTIKQLVELIISLSNHKITVAFDTSRPDGSPRRNSDNTLAKKLLHFSPRVSLREGLARTVEWYQSQLVNR